MRIPRRTRLPAYLAGGMGLTLASPALADPPPADAYQIRYYITDEQGDRGRELSLTDLQGYGNRARGECGQDIRARVAISSISGYDEIQTDVHVGSHCAEGVNLGSQYFPCAKVASEFPVAFTKQPSPEYAFDPIWLAWGASGVDTAVSLATPAGTCSSGDASGGIWMCAGVEDCMMGNFFISGNQQENGGDEASGGIAYDFQAPAVTPTDLEVLGGDDAVKINWTLSNPGDINGFRVLCADMDGNPIDSLRVTAPAIDRRPDGQYYYTRNNLCPGGLFGDNYDPDNDSAWGDGDGDGDGGDGDGDSTLGEPTFPNSGIESLDWDYVCSGHIASNSTSIRVEGLENGVEYQFLLVAYDNAGNPRATEVVVGKAVETRDLWEQ